MNYTTFAAFRALLFALPPSALTFLFFAGIRTSNGDQHASAFIFLAFQLAALCATLFAGVFGMELWARRQRLHTVLWSIAVLLFVVMTCLGGLTAHRIFLVRFIGGPLPTIHQLVQGGINLGLWFGTALIWVTLLPPFFQRVFHLSPRHLPTLSGPLVPAALLPLALSALATYALSDLHTTSRSLAFALGLFLTTSLLFLLAEGVLLAFVPRTWLFADSDGFPLQADS